MLMLVHELGDAEHPKRQRDDFDAVEQFVIPKVKRG